MRYLYVILKARVCGMREEGLFRISFYISPDSGIVHCNMKCEGEGLPERRGIPE